MQRGDGTAPGRTIYRSRAHCGPLGQRVQSQVDRRSTHAHKARLDLTKEIESKKSSLQNEYNNAQRDLQFQQQEIFGKIQEALSPIIKAIREEKGLTVILDKRSIVDFDPSIEITDEVVQRYNKASLAAPAAQPAPAPAAAPAKKK